MPEGNRAPGAICSIVRGCGKRVISGAYWETGLTPYGSPLEDFILDPPVRIDAAPLGLSPIGVKLIEKDGVWHLVDWVGSAHYPNAADILEETKRFGLSRRLPQTLEFDKLTPASRILLVHAKGWVCNADEYYHAMVRSGDALMCPKEIQDHSTFAPSFPQEAIPVEPARFWSKVSGGKGCWVWTGSDNGRGYGQFWEAGRMVYAHRHAYEIQRGPIPDGAEVCHQCDNPPCVRGAHLFAASHTENVRDARAKQRIRDARGERASGAKLTDEQVAEIRARRASGEGVRALGSEFGVDHSQISRICTGANWSTVDERLPSCCGLWWDDIDDGVPVGTDPRLVRRKMPWGEYFGKLAPDGVSGDYAPAIIARFPLNRIAVVKDDEAGSHEGVVKKLETAGHAPALVDE